MRNVDFVNWTGNVQRRDLYIDSVNRNNYSNYFTVHMTLDYENFTWLSIGMMVSR